MPPPKAKQLVKRSLALAQKPIVDLKGGKRTRAGWERRIGEPSLSVVYLAQFVERYGFIKQALGT